MKKTLSTKGRESAESPCMKVKNVSRAELLCSITIGSGGHALCEDLWP